MPGLPLQWRHLNLPSVVLGESDGDRLEIRMRSRTVPEADWNGSHFAMGVVVTVAAGRAERHDNVLMGTTEPSVLADLISRALGNAAINLTITLFDDGMTVQMEGTGADIWTVICRSVPLPPPDATWKTFPEFSFAIGRGALEHSRRELWELTRALQ